MTTGPDVTGPDAAGPVPVPRPSSEPEHLADPVAATVAAATAALPQQVRDRFATLERLRAAGSIYPVTYPRTRTCAEVREEHQGVRPGDGTGAVAGVAGRIVAVRDHGRVCFAVLRDWSGDLQVLLESPVSGRTSWTGFCATSTSATTSASPAKWSPRAAASCPCPPRSGR